MGKLDASDYFSIRRVNQVTPSATEPLRKEQLAAAHAGHWNLDVAVMPVKISFPGKTPEWRGSPVVTADQETYLGKLGLRGLLTVTKYFPPTLSMGLAEPGEVNEVLAHVDLHLAGVVPPLRYRGYLLDLVTDMGDPVFQEVPLMYDEGRYRQAGLPPLPSPSKTEPDVPPMPGSE